MRTKIISLSEIGILLVAIFAFAFMVAEVDSVQAQTTQCCELTTEGGVCQPVLDSRDCAEGAGLTPTSCERTTFCKEGCCIDTVEGTYVPDTPRLNCTYPNSQWVDDEACNVPGAGKGCCVLGDDTAFVTSTKCGRLAELRGFDINFRTDLDVGQCVILSTIQTEGACILGDGCKFTTLQECSGLNGQFAEGFLCTSPDLNTSCTRTKETGCANGRDEVYFLDSCGNRGNIYDSSKTDEDNYWNAVIAREDACNPTEGNANSEDCGNCNRFLGGVCAAADSGINPDEGEFYCRDTSCEFKGENYQNGESWCVYEGKIGEGDDVVGSRHWRYVCNRGEVQIEPCADYRQQVCVQSETDLGEGEKFLEANCRVNNWRKCIDLNNVEADVSKCAELPDCFVKEITFADSFNFNFCVPKYPEGFNLNSNRGQEEICGQGTRTCMIMYEKKGGKCKAVDNKACDGGIFTEEMNDLCTSLGDCGGQVNVIGEYSGDGYKVDGAPMLGEEFIKGLAKMADPANYVGQYAEVGNITAYLQASGLLGFGVGNESEEEEGEEEGGGNIGKGLGMGLSGVGLAISAYSHFSTAAPVMGSQLIGAVKAGMGGAKVAVAGAPGGISATAAGFANALMAAGIIVGASLLIVSLLGKQPSNVGILAGAAAGLAAYYGSALIATEIFIGQGIISAGSYGLFYGAMLAANAALFIGIGIVVAVAIMYFTSGIPFTGDCPPEMVTYTCEPWEPSVGGDKCGECDSGGDADPEGVAPCTEYKCKSLGAACNFLNQGTDEEVCVDENPNDITPPVIDPDLQLINENYKYNDIGANSFRVTNLEGGCLEAYEPLYFGVITDEPAQCKFDLEMKDSFDDMSYNLGSGGYVYNHTISFPVPDPSHGQSQGLKWDGNINLYIKCRDTHDNEIPSYYNVEMCVNQGKDITAPVIRTIFPADGWMVGYNATSQQAFFYTNEPSDCKWSLKDEHYNLMEGEMECVNDITQITAFGYMCVADLDVSSGENNYYVRCADQPWLEGVGQHADRNFMEDSFDYSLKKVSSPLSIKEISPKGDLEVDTSPATVELKVETAGGGDYPSCLWSFLGHDNWADAFPAPDGNVHTYVFDYMTPKNYKVFIECSDETGDSVRGQTIFRITKDTSSPQLARIFQDGSTLTLITTEEADCEYSIDVSKRCNFNFGSGESAGGGEKHTFSVVKGKKYYIKCEDEFGHGPSGCTAIVQAT